MNKEAKFFLDKPKQAVPTFIFLKFSCNDGVLKYSVQKKLLPGYWDFDQQRVIRVKDNKILNSELQKINSELERLHTIVEQYQESCRIMHKPTLKEELRSELNGITHRKIKSNHELNFFVYVDVLVNEAKAGTLLTDKGKKYSSGTIINWIKAKDRLEEFNEHLTFDNITLETYKAFVKFCNDRQYSLNYTGGLVKNWKTFMNLANTKGWHNNLIYKHNDFKKFSEESQQVALDDNEIKLIYDLDLSHNTTLEVIRDRYIINLFTGLRVSDMKTLSEDNFGENDNITHINKKTDKKVVIPVHSMIDAIRAKYKGNLPYQYHENVVNREIKVIAAMAGLKGKIRYTKTIGGETKEFVVAKYKLITNHTARRSMVTNLLKYADAFEVMPVVGISLRTLETYNKRTPEENARLLKENKFFKK